MVKCVTKNWSRAFLPCLYVVILSLSLFGCGGTFRSFPNQGDVSGSWSLFLTPSNTSALAPKLCTLTQTGNDISGTISDGAAITGTVSGNNISLTVDNTGGTTTTLAGTIGADWKTMSGTYTSTGSDGSGNWSATKNIPTPTRIAVTPTSATLSCSGTTGGTSVTCVVTGGIPGKYSVVASTNGTLVTLSAITTSTASGQFTVTANACSAADGTIVDLLVSDTVTSVTVPVKILNP